MGNDAQRRAAFAYNAAADFYDASPLGFWKAPELPRFQLLNSSGLKER
jgi:hypothetical protein